MRSITVFSRIACLFLLIGMAVACGKDSKVGEEKANVQLKFAAVVDNAPLVFGTNYTNTFGESYSLSVFKFYIHDIRFTSTTGAEYKVGADKHYLVNISDTATLRIPLTIPANDYNLISFKIGVDSTRNFSGAQTDALDPTNGMFWTWNTGYIMAKLEGNTTVAATPNNKFEYHIGGYKAGENVIRSVAMNFPRNVSMTIYNDQVSFITINANANKWFNGPNRLSIATNPVCTTPGALAMKFADNYQESFYISAFQ